MATPQALRSSAEPLFILSTALILFFFGMTLHADEAPVRILAMGDSTTAGTPFFRSPVEVPPDGEGDDTAPYTHWLVKDREDWMVFNRGVAGERTDEIFERFKKDVPRFKPNVVIVMAGVNDFYQGHSAKRVENRLEEIYQFAIENKLTLITCSILPYNEASDAIREKIAEANRWIKEYSEKNSFLFCDTAALVEAEGKPGYLAGSPDGLHPDKANYRKIGEAIKLVLEKSHNSFNNN